MSGAKPEEFLPDGRHWADVIGCDMRAGLREIQKAAARRTTEAMDKLRGAKLSEALLEIGEALDQATRIKAGHRRHRGEIER